ncbi:uncharacterized protein BP5553_05672 [Venustampulla echinocandica]|uniref:Uncharacterized protein n=1 Tax=Venustampulla echinocandica TaxID=2656787 RepID=A0A370TLB6_9HELO|nr:uncharacterized protein BP5553_05672 [Venustampulla echinocandica]RDL36320.1 hypothetical protein BP5553_05672 [Venustampulla echinocandica]
MADTSEIEEGLSQLLTDLLPIFEASARERAKFHKLNGDNDYRKFFYYLQVELVVLRSKHGSEALDLGTTRRALALLNSIITHSVAETREEPYSTLRAIENGEVSCDSVLAMPANSDEILMDLEDCGTLKDDISIPILTYSSTIRQPPGRDIRLSADKLYQGISNCWPCICGLGHEGMLYLATHHSESIGDGITYDFLFGTLNPRRKWQEAKICVIHSSDPVSSPIPTIVVHRPNKVPNDLNPQFGPAIESLCSATPSNNNVKLSLVIANDGVWKGRPERHQSFARSLQVRISLRQVLERELLTRKRTIAQVLAVVLANSALQLSGTPWLPASWGIDDIYFLGSENNAIALRPTILAPFVSGEVDTDEVNLTQLELATDLGSECIHPNRHILALGIVLLELFFKTPIQTFRMPEHLTATGQVDANTDYWAATMAWEQEDWDVHDRYKEAVRSCLYWPEDRESNFDSLSLHKILYNEVVRELEEELEAYKLTVPKLDAYLRPYKLAANFSSQEAQSVQPVTNHSLADNMLESQLETSSQHHHSHELPWLSSNSHAGSIIHCQENQYRRTVFSFFDNNEPRLGSAAHADDWFRLYRAKVRPLLPHYSSPSGRVKIAILDTGIDLGEDVISSLTDRIIKNESFLVDDKSTDDLDGHGTHVAGLILRVAPNSELYIARIAKNQSLLDKISIVNALKEAINWGVDIISMSFGFTAYNQDLEELQAVIKEVFRRDILMFCAASNNGGNGDIAYPADRDEVICINAADGEGSPSGFNPGEATLNRNFCALGENVKSSWPTRFNLGDQRKSGTSFATPIAASFAAIILGFCGNHKESASHVFEISKLKTRQGMMNALKLMGRKKGSGYLWLDPGKLFDSSRRDIFGDIIAVANK